MWGEYGRGQGQGRERGLGGGEGKHIGEGMMVDSGGEGKGKCE